MSYNRIVIEQKLKEFLREDCMFTDVSSKVIPEKAKASAKIFAKSTGFISGSYSSVALSDPGSIG